MGCLCACCTSMLRMIARAILGIINIGICVAIITIVFFHLTNYESNGQTYTCLLNTQDTPSDLCTYAYIVSGVSMAGLLWLMLSGCCTCCICWKVVEPWTDWAITLAGTLWWLAAALVFTNYASAANNENDINQNWRNTVIVLSWIILILFAADYIGSQIRLCVVVCGYCSCCGGKKEKAKREEEKAKAEEEKKAKVSGGGDIEAPTPNVMQPPPQTYPPTGPAKATPIVG